MVIKLKAEKKKYLKPIIICLIVFIIWQLICFIADNSFNGVLLDWFTENYMVERYTTGMNGETLLMWEPSWFKLKVLFVQATVFIIIVDTAVVYVVSHIKARTKNRETVSDISRDIHEYIACDRDVSEIFPKEYAEISAQMVEIKSAMQHHEQALRDEAARKNDLITYLAHDLKTPLTSVIGYMSLLDEVPDMPEKQREKYVHITLDKAKRLESLINEFFDITRYNLQHIELEKETIDLYYMLMQLTDEFYPLLQAHGNRVELDVDENMQVYGDADKLARVFNNILKNAIAYSYPDTSIKISAKEDEDSVKIYMMNQGKTIPPTKLKSIFEKFFRLDDARRTNTGGAGLGLAIAREIVELHGGSIWAESENETTTFCVSLPKRDK